MSRLMGKERPASILAALKEEIADMTELLKLKLEGKV